MKSSQWPAIYSVAPGMSVIVGTSSIDTAGTTDSGAATQWLSVVILIRFDIN